MTEHEKEEYGQLLIAIDHALATGALTNEQANKVYNADFVSIQHVLLNRYINYNAAQRQTTTSPLNNPSMSTTRAKFKVDYVQDFGTSATVKLSPVYGTSGENKTFWDATPCGSIELMIQNRTALAGFKPQAEFYIDFTPVESTNTQVLRNVATPPRIPGDHPRG